MLDRFWIVPVENRVLTTRETLEYGIVLPKKGKKKMWVSGCGIDRQQSKAKGAMPEQRSLASSWFR